MASLGLSKFVNEDKTFNYEKLHEVTKIVVSNLNKVIDINFYPTEKTRRSNYLHRPIGLGVQGLADVFAMMDIAFHSDEAKEINKNIFETIYHAAVERSCEIAQERKEGMIQLLKWYHKDQWGFKNKEGQCRTYIFESQESRRLLQEEHKIIIDYLSTFKPTFDEITKLQEYCIGSYSSFIGSPISQGIFKFDMWNVSPSDRYDWDTLRVNITQQGLRNSLLIAPMPTASTSQILGNNECFEPFTSNLYVRRTLAGEFVCINKHLQKELTEMKAKIERLEELLSQKGINLSKLKLK